MKSAKEFLIGILEKELRSEESWGPYNQKSTDEHNEKANEIRDTINELLKDENRELEDYAGWSNPSETKAFEKRVKELETREALSYQKLREAEVKIEFLTKRLEKAESELQMRNVLNKGVEEMISRLHQSFK